MIGISWLRYAGLAEHCTAQSKVDLIRSGAVFDDTDLLIF